jgi:hypothetical protein
MAGDLLNIFLLSLVSTLNPTLLAAVTVMLLLPHPKQLMFGYLVGAYVTSIGSGLLIVLWLHGSSTESTSKHAVSPAEDIIVGLLALTLAWILRTQRDQRLRERRRKRRDAKVKAKQEAGKPTESLPLRLLGRGDPRVTFVVGAVLSFPGVAYLFALDRIHRLNAGPVSTVLLVLVFCLLEQLFLEVPLTGYVIAPGRTQEAVAAFKAWMSRRGRTAGVIGAAAIGTLVLARGVITLL